MLVVTSGKMVIQMLILLLRILSQVKPTLALEEGELLAYAAVTKSPEATYEAIYEGKWQSGESEYLVFHRIAVAADVQGQGVAQTFQKA